MDFRITEFENFMKPIIKKYISLDILELRGSKYTNDYIYLHLSEDNGVGVSIYEHDNYANYLITDKRFNIRVMSNFGGNYEI